MKACILIAYVCFTTIVGHAQYIRWVEGQSLTWDDFVGKVNDSSQYDAECFAEIRYEYRFFTANRFEFEVYASFNKGSSWRRKEMETEALLKHEQMHFDIAELFAIKLKNDFENYSYTANYNEQILFLFEKRKQEYQAMQRLYDEETNHSLNKDRQKEWEDFIMNELHKSKLDLQIVEISNQPLKEGT
jgi:hypothetical protein